MKRPIPFHLALIPLLTTILILVLLVFVLKLPLYIGLLIGAITAFGIARAHGYSTQELAQAALTGMKNTKPVVIIILVIGALVPVWMASGTVPALVYYGLNLVNPEYLLASAFVLTAATSMILGTSIGTLSTMGVALLGIGFSLGLPKALVAGAVVSGAFFGERSSPMSSAANLAASAVEIEFNKMLRFTLSSGILGFFLALGGYLLLGLNFHVAPGHTQNSQLALALAKYFNISWPMLLPAVLVIVASLLKLPTKYSLGIGILAGGAIALLMQNITYLELSKIILLGYHAHTGSVEIDSVLKGGGIIPILSLNLLILTAGAFNGITAAAGMLQQIAEKLVAKIKSPPALVVTTILFSTAVALVVCNQTLPILMPGQLFRSLYDQRGIAREVLARTLTDSGLLISGLIPWNMVAILSATAIGVPTLEYAPYALFLWFMPIITIVLAYLTLKHSCAFSEIASVNH
ncbi:MAG TPA: Na+/H+ antiporter NhaC family protein [Candidatus Deferrimicrobium sp.]|nr:Na+/H+ antiporter NhaC family protein [Candidatus Deferrimicrobium sp.]